MPDRQAGFPAEAELLIARIRQHAGELYRSRQLLCTEAVVVALNRDLAGGLSEDQAIALAAPFCAALGESGCLCGALSGAVMACGLLLGKRQSFRRRREVRDSARQLHDAFKALNGATCCRVLSHKVRHDRKAHFRQCADLTAQAAELAARLVLQQRPELISGSRNGISADPPAKIEGALLRMLRLFSG